MPSSHFEPNRRELLKQLYTAAATRCDEDADKVLNRAQQTAPVYGSSPAPKGHSPGTYRRSLKKQKARNGYEVVADVYYAIWVEYGSRRVQAHHTLGRALDSIKER